MKINRLSFLAGVLVVVSCGSVEVTPTDPPAVKDLKQYLAIGSGLTAGYSQGGLFRDAQLNSFPNLLAQQLKVAGFEDFKQPLFDANQANGTGFLQARSLSPLVVEKVNNGNAIRSNTPLLFTKFKGTNHNYGVPNMKMSDVGKPGYGNPTNTYFNPFFERLLPDNQAGTSYLETIKNTKFDFYTCELGLNDVLDYALGGGTKIMTPVETFAMSCRQIFTILGEKKVSGFVMNIPNIESLPQFVKVSTIKKTFFVYSAGMIREAAADELILASAVEMIGKKHDNGNAYGLSKAEPIRNEDVLDANELARLRRGINDLNAVIKTEAQRQNLTVIDLYSVYNTISNGSFLEKGVQVKSEISTTGFYSVDGVYPTARGNAILANEVIKALNIDLKKQSQKEVSMLDLAKFKGSEVK